jgi:hypothetical protein
MLDGLIQKMLAEWLRKTIASACGVWITLLVTKGVATKSDMDTFIQIGVAILIFVGNALYTRIKNKVQGKTAVTIPTVMVPEVVATAAAISPAVSK